MHPAGPASVRSRSSVWTKLRYQNSSQFMLMRVVNDELVNHDAAARDSMRPTRNRSKPGRRSLLVWGVGGMHQVGNAMVRRGVAATCRQRGARESVTRRQFTLVAHTGDTAPPVLPRARGAQG